jgi:hypothetical protein
MLRFDAERTKMVEEVLTWFKIAVVTHRTTHAARGTDPKRSHG